MWITRDPHSAKSPKYVIGMNRALLLDMKTITIPMTAALLMQDAANAQLGIARADHDRTIPTAPGFGCDSAYVLSLMLALADIEAVEHRAKSLRSLVEEEIARLCA